MLVATNAVKHSAACFQYVAWDRLHILSDLCLSPSSDYLNKHIQTVNVNGLLCVVYLVFSEAKVITELGLFYPLSNWEGVFTWSRNLIPIPNINSLLPLACKFMKINSWKWLQTWTQINDCIHSFMGSLDQNNNIPGYNTVRWTAAQLYQVTTCRWELSGLILNHP